MTISDWLMIIAIVIAPIAAIQIQKHLENSKEIISRKMQVFKTLMATRATLLSPYHVEALNMIDIEFYNNKNIVDAWKLLLDNFANYPKDIKDPNYHGLLNSCSEKSKELHTNLLYEMAISLGYNFDKVHLMRGAYIPQAHVDIELGQEFIRRSLVKVFSGELPIPIKVIDTDENEKK
jgi:hypothetical protein